MRFAVLALLLASAPVLAQPSDAPRRCLTAADEAAINAVLRLQHQDVARLAVENAELRKRTVAIAESKQSPMPVVLAVLLGAAAGVTVALWAVAR